MNSRRDMDGNLFVDCTECQLGCNGNGDCSAGWAVSTPRRGGCIKGVLLEKPKPLPPVRCFMQSVKNGRC